MLPVFESIKQFFAKIQEKEDITESQLDSIFELTISDNTCKKCKKYQLKNDELDEKKVCNSCNWKIDWKRCDSGNFDCEDKCDGRYKSKVCDNYRCKLCSDKSFLSSDKARYWNYAINEVRPREISSKNSKFTFRCEACNHLFTPVLKSVKDGKWCPYCSVPCQKLCDLPSCDKCFKKSFACSDRAICWSKKNKKAARQAMLGANTKYFFDCNVCNHTFDMKPAKISKGQWCPYCNFSKMCYREECKFCFHKSFASVENVEFWDCERNDTTPRDIIKNSHTKCWFICENKHSFSMTLYHVTGDGRWCPLCRNKTEAKLKTFLHKLTYIKTTYQPKFSWCCSPETGRYYPFDFLLENKENKESKEMKTPDLKVIIELDGRQHFEQVQNWTNFMDSIERDRYKSKRAIENGYSLIRIVQEDVWNDVIDWKKQLKDTITMVRTAETPKIYYIAKKVNLYDNHKKE